MKSMVRNTLGSKTFTTYLPCGTQEAQAFASAVLDGETEVYKVESVSGTDTALTGRDVNVMIQNDTTSAKTYLRFIVKSSKHEGDVVAALQGKTFNGVKADKVVIVGMRSAEY